METPQDTNYSINSNSKMINLDQAIVMGILNITPDSFFDGGKYKEEKHILSQVKSMISDGMSIIDIGGQSTRPGAKIISEKEEIDRVIPIIKLLKLNFESLIISVDTFRSKVAQKSIEAGAHLINDISGGTMDTNMFKTIGKLQVPYVLMHIKGTPENMQNNPSYSNVVTEVKTFFTEKIKQLHSYGVEDIILDPGFGFGKTTTHNYELLNNINQFKELGFPVLIGASRKSMINKVLGTSPKEALNGTTVINTIALMKGANILRVHDVKEAKEAIQLVGKL